MERSFIHAYQAEDDHCREAVLRDLPADLPAELHAVVSQYRRGGSLEDIEAVLDGLDPDEHDQQTHDACLALRSLLDCHLLACSCTDEAWWEFEQELQASLASLGERGWAVTVSEGLSPYELDPYLLDLGDIQDYGLSPLSDARVEGDDTGVRIIVDGVERGRFVSVPADRSALYEHLVEIGHPDAFSYALAVSGELREICEHLAASLRGAGLWLPEHDPGAEAVLDTSALPDLSPAEREVARGLARSWAASLRELFHAAQSCVLTS